MMGAFVKHIVNPKKNKPTPKEQFFDENGHLNDSGISLYTEGILLKRVKEVPKNITKHLETCPHCAVEAMDFYEFMKDEDLSHLNPHPYFDAFRPFRFLNNIQINSTYRKVAAVFLLTILSSIIYLIFSSPAKTISDLLESPFNNGEIQVKFQAWEIENDQAETIQLPNGSSIHIPDHTFMYADGKPVMGQIQIKYREFHQASDIISSGIPTNFKNFSGQNYPMETAGLFEIRGTKNGIPVYIVPGKKIEVHMATLSHSSEFNHYYLDENPQNQNLSILSTPISSPAYAQETISQWVFLSKSIALPYLDFALRMEMLKTEKIPH